MLDSFLAELERKGLQENVPIVSREVAEFLRFLVGLTTAGNILEIGTAIGYSTLWLAGGLRRDSGKITTIEIQEERMREAQVNIAASGLGTQIEFILGDAKDVLLGLQGTYDFIFLDSAKGQYVNLLPECLRLLAPGGLLVTDNVYFRGMVKGEQPVNPRFKTIVKRLQEYLETIQNHPQLVTTVLPMGDGLALSYKKAGENDD